MVRWGSPVNVSPRSQDSIIIVEPTLGIDASQPSVDAPLGSTPGSDNLVMRDGALEPRPMLSLRNTTPQPFGNDPTLGGMELVSTVDGRYPVVSGTTRLAAYGLSGTPNGWSVLSYVSSNGINDPPNVASTQYWDACQIYYPLRDENVAIFGAGSYQSLYCTQSNTTVFSSLTGAPQAKYVTTFDNYVVTFNQRQGSSDFVQRVQWSDRGDPSAWTTGTSGFEDLMAMRGQGTRVVGLENRLLLFSDSEVWQGVRGDNVFIFSFAPYDRSVGCPYSWTVAATPLGVIFLSKDYEVYLLPKSGGPALPIGQRLHRSIRDSIDQPTRAWAVYDHTYGQYQLFYPIKGGSGRPQRAVYLDINTGAWAPQSFDLVGGNLSLTRGFEAYVSSSATTWGGLQAQGITWAQLGQSWSQLGGTSEARAILVGSSSGTMYTFDSAATSDNGTAVQSRWRSTGLAGLNPSHQKTVSEWRMDYQSDSASSMTVRFSTNGGQSFGVETQVNLPATSGLSQAIVYPYMSARYPMFECASEGQRYRAFRFYTKMKEGGR